MTQTSPPKRKLLPAAPKSTNASAARIFVHTIVTADMTASLRFYREGFEMAIVDEGELAIDRPEVPGVGIGGRRYALLAPADRQEPERGYLRLLEAPAGASANRPRPASSIRDNGMATIECVMRDRAESMQRILGAGGTVISDPQYYFFRDVETINGVEPGVVSRDYDVWSYSAFGPAGEQMFITWSENLFPGAWPYESVHSPFYNCVLIGPTRKLIWDYYDALMGLKPLFDVYVGQEPVATLIGAPPGTAFRYSVFGENCRYETWEYLPPSAVTWPTSLDRTGFAMDTLVVGDLAKVRANAERIGAPILAEGHLPMPLPGYGPAIYLRGPVGELIEIVERPRQGGR